MSKGKNTANLELITTKIKTLERKSIANVAEIGRLLEQASDQCDHGEYEDWLEANFGWSLTTVHRYRAVFRFSKSTNLADLNISVSALYLAIDLPWIDGRHKAIIAAAKKGRVSYSRAKQIIDEVDAKCGLKIELLPDEVTPPKIDEAPPPPSDDDVKDKPTEYQDWLAEEDIPEPVKLLQRLDELLRQQQHHDWAKAIKDVGPIRIREIIHLLTAALDEYSVKNAVKAKADAAEAKSKAPLPIEREQA